MTINPEKIPLFKDISEKDLDAMLRCLGAYERDYRKGEFISLAGENQRMIGVVLCGEVHMIKEDYWGGVSLYAFIHQTEIFGETFACGNPKNSSVSFKASLNSSILFLDFDKILRTCESCCVFHRKLIDNMVGVIAAKNRQMMDKLEILSQKTIRQRILLYLSERAAPDGDYADFPAGRLEMAEYLCVDRSAMTREMNHMREDGILDFDRIKFRLK